MITAGLRLWDGYRIMAEVFGLSGKLADRVADVLWVTGNALMLAWFMVIAVLAVT